MSNEYRWYHRLWDRILQELRWLTPGLGVKRWIGLTVGGALFLGIGIGSMVLDLYIQELPGGGWWFMVLSVLSLRFIPLQVRVVIILGLGLVMIVLGIMGTNRSLLRPFLRPGRPVLETVSAFRRKERGPKIVTMGGGNGLASLLRGLKKHTINLSAIVTVADDGGSSGELRRTVGILPPGDIRNCLTALSTDERLLAQIFQYRFAAGAGINGHNLGNLFITALAEITGSFEEAVAESGRVLAVQGQVLPATLHDVKLVASVVLPD